MACENICAKVVNDSLHSCDSKGISGIEQRVKLINRCDITLSDWTVNRSLTPSACSHVITAYSGEDPADLNAVTIEGIPGKRLLNAAFPWSNGDFGINYTHTVNLFTGALTQLSICNLKALSEGAEVIAIIEQKFKGAAGVDAFLVYGWDQGLKLADGTFDHNENNGNLVIPLSSIDPDLEPYPPLVLLMTDYDTTKAFFDSL
ncbi:hypothetical protein [Parapedobacter lycopersici]|uniref:hypothetical protein n=1 Tax=Parapedobacter lycopersici TaxID=1864939 RepID=UPI00214D4C33|nr:hypothetical protein [Parapedobacter lycopersici]